jgi:hypothetical protein
MTGSTIILAILAICYKSKCKNIKCLGCIEIERDVEGEEELDEIEMNNNEERKD